MASVLLKNNIFCINIAQPNQTYSAIKLLSILGRCKL